MTFNSTSRNMQKPLIDNAQEQFTLLQNTYLEFIKIYEEISDYDKKLDHLSKKEYEVIKDNVHSKIQLLPQQLNSITNLSANLKTAEFNDNQLKLKVDEQIKIINEKLKPKKENLHSLINRIIEREGHLAKRLSVRVVDEGGKQSDSSSFDSFIDQKEPRLRDNSFRESKLIVQDYSNDLEYLQKRQAELEEIKKVSAQIKDITVNMKSQVGEQGLELKIAENNVVEAQTNVKKAELEIEAANKDDKKASHYTFWAAIIIFCVVMIILSLVLIFTLS